MSFHWRSHHCTSGHCIYLYGVHGGHFNHDLGALSRVTSRVQRVRALLHRIMPKATQSATHQSPTAATHRLTTELHKTAGESHTGERENVQAKDAHAYARCQKMFIPNEITKWNIRCEGWVERVRCMKCITLSRTYCVSKHAAIAHAFHFRAVHPQI